MLAPLLCVPLLAPQGPLVADPGELERTVRDLVAFGTRHVLSATDDPDRGTGAARDYLESRYRALIDRSRGRLVVERQEFEVPCRRRGMPAAVRVVNVVATLPGRTDPDRVYVIAGHYDSINGTGSDGERDAPGANDDASGTAAALEACRLLCERDFAATIVFCAYDGEEQGLLGSSAHADALAASGTLVDGMITNDIVGNTMGMDGVRRDGYVRVFSYAPRGEDSLGRSLARAASWASRRVDGLDAKLIYRGDRYGRGGDHRPFFEKGWPAVRLTEPREDDSRQHQDVTERNGKPYGDLPDYMDFDYLARVASLDAELLSELASAPRAPDRVRVAGARGRYDTIVSVAEVDGAASYEVVWRETTSADWERRKRVRAEDLDFSGPRGARILLEDVCIDDVVVGVCSVSESGHRSRVTAAPDPDAWVYRSAARDGR